MVRASQTSLLYQHNSLTFDTFTVYGRKRLHEFHEVGKPLHRVMNLCHELELTTAWAQPHWWRTNSLELHFMLYGMSHVTRKEQRNLVRYNLVKAKL